MDWGHIRSIFRIWLLTVEFKQVVFNQETIFGGWRIYHNGCDFSFFKLKTKMTGGILVQSQSSFEGSEIKIDLKVIQSQIREQMLMSGPEIS